MVRRRITLKDIASELGLSIASVSMAMRGQRQISRATRERVVAKANELGYQADPALRALADYRTNQGPKAERWKCIALIHDWETPDAWHTHEYYGNWFVRLKRIAQERGIGLEEHWLGHKGCNSKAVFRSLHYRGITGILIAPPSMSQDPVEISVPEQYGFQVVTFGPEHLYRQFHTVQLDFYENLRLAWSSLWSKGFRRIGLLYQKHQGWRTGQAWRAAYHIEKLETGCKPGTRMPLMVEGVNGKQDQEAYLKWVTRDRYDAVISSMHEVEQWNVGLKEPPVIAIFNVLRPGQQGIELNVDSLLRSAIELLYVEMQQSLIEQQSLPFRLHIPGSWVDSKPEAEDLKVAKSLPNSRA